MKNEKQVKIANCDSRANKMKYFYTIGDFPKFKILEENYKGILNELLSVIEKEKLINLGEKKNEKVEAFFDGNDFIYGGNDNVYGKNISWKIYGKDNNNKEDAKEEKLSEEVTDKIVLNGINSHGNNNRSQHIINVANNRNEISKNNNSNKLEDNKNNNTKTSNYKIYVNDKEDFTTELLEHQEKTYKAKKEIEFLSSSSNSIQKPKKDTSDTLPDQETANSNDSLKTFEPWVEKNLYSDSNEKGWDVAPLMIGGVKIPERCAKFPILAGLVSQISGVVSASFSLLKPGTHIVPHKGYDDYSEKMFRYHMGLIVPSGDIGIRVENEFKKWENGKSFVFDDFLIHEAWNFTTSNRIVLIIDFLKDETKVPENVKFFDANFNKSIKGYLNNFDENNTANHNN